MRSGIFIALGFSLTLHAVIIIGGTGLPHSHHEQKKQVVGFRVITTRERTELKAPTPKAATDKPATPYPNASDLEQLPIQAADLAPTGTTKPSQNSLVARPMHYLAPFEVDVRARPESEWVMNTEEMEPTKPVTFQLTIYVSAEGVLDDFEVIASSENEMRTQLILRDLQATKFVPAMKDGHKVSSKRDVEITLDNTPIPYGIRRFFGITQTLN